MPSDSITKKDRINAIKLSRTFLFVDDDSSACSAVRRISQMLDVDVQTANNAHNALALIQNDPEKYFLILADQFMPNLTGDELLERIKDQWPHIRRAMISGDETSLAISKGYENAKIFKYIKKPVDEIQIRLLIEDACQHVISVEGNTESIIADRCELIDIAISNAFSNSFHADRLNNFSKKMLKNCQAIWQALELFQLPLVEIETEKFKAGLSSAINNSCFSARHLIEESKQANSAFMLKDMLKQFELKSLGKHNRIIKYNEAIFSSILDKWIRYCQLVQLDPQKAVVIAENKITLWHGNKYTYNDVFNPTLDCVEGGIEIVALHFEISLLLTLLRVPIRPYYANGLYLDMVV